MIYDKEKQEERDKSKRVIAKCDNPEEMIANSFLESGHRVEGQMSR